MHRDIVVPTKHVVLVAVALLLSVLFNIASISLPSIVERHGVPDRHTALPLSLRRVALVAANAEQYGIYDADDWDKLYPPGMGFVRLDSRYYLVTMYHQMHCLNSFRRYLHQYRAGTWNATEGTARHIEHCMQYLRQAVLCNADTALEPAILARTAKGEVVHAATGKGVVQECRDWTQVYEWVVRNHEEWEEDDDFEVL